MKVSEYIEAALSSSRDSVFSDESKLDFDYLPPRLPHRDKQLKRLAEIFRITLENPGKASTCALIFGEVGAGKTVLAKFFGEGMVKIAKSRNLQLNFIYINCRTVESKWSLIMNVAAKLSSQDLAVRGYGPNQLLRGIYDYLNDNDMFLLLALDEADFFIKRTGDNIVYDFTRFGEDLENLPKRIATIFIARDQSIYMAPQLDQSTVSSLRGVEPIELPSYRPIELKDILAQRAIEAFKPNTVSDLVVEFIAGIAGGQGDARYAIELLAFAGRYADQDYARRVTPEHVRRARSKIHPQIRREDLTLFSAQEKAILLSVSRSLEPDEVHVGLNDIRKAYEVCCEEYTLTRLGLAQLQGTLIELARTGLINVERIKGRLLVSLPEIPVDNLRSELEMIFENDNTSAT